jgi:hypothetical protein
MRVTPTAPVKTTMVVMMTAVMMTAVMTVAMTMVAVMTAAAAATKWQCFKNSWSSIGGPRKGPPIFLWTM